MERAEALENSSELERIHATAALQGDTEPPADAEEEVDFHFICFVLSQSDGHVYELDGDRKGPVDHGPILKADEDLVGKGSLNLVRSYIEREDGLDDRFSLMALVDGR